MNSTLVKEVTRATVWKGLTSQMFKFLLSTIKDPATFKSRAQWTEDIGEIIGEQWDMALQFIPIILLSTFHKLTHLFILHRFIESLKSCIGRVREICLYILKVKHIEGILST